MPMLDRGWVAPALFGVALITLARIVLQAFNQADLFVDEAQYWLWGQELAFGYYSKPPMIGWVIRFFTEIGSDAPFWVRFPAPLFHGITAMLLGAVAARLSGPRAGVVTALGYVTLPIIAVGSFMISTDTVMFPFLAAALLGYVTLLDRPTTRVALLTGFALGLGFMSKYAAIYYLICGLLAALAIPRARLPLKTVGQILLAFLVAISPNLIWNVLNDLSTVQHTMDNADWVRDPAKRVALNWAGLGEFFGAQFIVFGPVFMVTLLIATATWMRRDATTRIAIVFSVPIILFVCVQALLSRAYANWAAAAYLMALMAVVPILLSRPRWLALSFVLNGAFCLFLPVALTQAETLKLGRAHLLGERYIGREAMSLQIAEIAQSQGVSTIVATNRDILADMFYSLRDREFELYSEAPRGRAHHHYALKFPYLGQADDILVVVGTPDASHVPCPDAKLVAELRPQEGAYRKAPQMAYLAPGHCLAP